MDTIGYDGPHYDSLGPGAGITLTEIREFIGPDVHGGDKSCRTCWIGADMVCEILRKALSDSK